jgi:hypothetical protein
MSSSLDDILKARNFAEPPEIKIIKAFVYSAIKSMPAVAASNDSFIITVPDSSSANALRFKLPTLQKKFTKKTRLIIRIGS